MSQTPCGTSLADFRQNAAGGCGQSYTGDEENDAAQEATQQGGLNNIKAGELRIAGEPVSCRETLVESSSASVFAPTDEEDHRRWVANYQRNEIIYLNARTEELEGRVRRRTIMLTAVAAFAALSAVTAAGMAIVRLTDPPRPDPVEAAASSPESQASSSQVARNSGPPLPSGPSPMPPANIAAAPEAPAGLAEPNQARDISAQDVPTRNRRINTLEHDLAEAQQAASRARQEANQLARQAQELTAARAELEQQLAEGSRARDQAAQELLARAQRIAALERDVAAAEARLAERSAEIEHLAADLRDASDVRDKLEKYAVERNKLLEQAGQDVRAAADRVGALERDLGLTQQQVGAAQKQFDERRTALEQQLASATQIRDQATRALEERDQRIASLEVELALARAAAERSGAEAQRLATATREVAETRSTAALQDLRLSSPEPAPGGAAAGWRKTVLEGDIFIVPGTEQLAPRASAPLGQVAELIRRSAGAVHVIGHMAPTGDADANRQLSLRRAQAIRDYLVSTYGFDRARFTVEGKGSDEPVASNDTFSGRQANRRVELFIAG